MKKATILHLFLFVSFITAAQTYSVTYNVRQNPNRVTRVQNSDNLPAGVKQALMAELKKDDSAQAVIKIYTLTCCNGVSTYAIFQNKKSAEQAPSLENQSGIIIQKMTMGDNTGVLYKNFSNKIMLKQSAIFDKPFLITDSLQSVNWDIDTATKTIGKFNCTKATATINGQQVEAWFTADIPIPDGPDKFYGLPGLILAVKTQNGNYEATEIKITNENTALQQPTKGTVMTGAEFDQLIKKKRNDIKNSFPSGGFFEVK